MRRRPHRHPRATRAALTASLLAWLAWGGCGDSGAHLAEEPDPAEGSGDEAPAVEPGEVVYALEWDLSRIERVAGGGWSVTNDLGHRFEVTRGFLVSASAELVECAPEASWWRSILGPSVAWAGHGGDVNPAAVTASRVESLTGLDALEFGAVRLGPSRYCQVHYLIGRADTQTLDMPTDLDLEGVSLLLEGTWTPPGGEPAPFKVETGLATAVLFDLFPPGGFGKITSAFELELEGTVGALVRVERVPGALLDGVAPDEMGEEAMARQILRNIIRSTRIEVLELD